MGEHTTVVEGAMATARDTRAGGADESPSSEELEEKWQFSSAAGVEAQDAKPTQPHPDQARKRLTLGDMGTASAEDGPEGGFDDTPIPTPPPGVVGYTLKITFHRATNLIMGDAHAFSSDPYVLAQLNTGLRQRHKEDPNLRFRSPTVRKNVDPEWNEDWIIANVPSSGFTLKVRVYDEDPADQDDLLGKCHIHVASVSDGWQGIKDEPNELSLRRSSKRAILVRSLAVCFGSVKHITGEIYVSIQNLGRTGEDGQKGRAYTLGPCRWFRHYSPLLGRIAGVKEPQKEGTQDCPVTGEKQKTIEQYNFQANQMQLQGPVPAELYHRFVEFKPWVARMFTAGGIQGLVLSKALHHQHARVYNFGRSTVHGYFPQGPCKEMTQQFLDLVHYDKGGRIFTYVVTIDALFRFTETGKEFGVDMLSKHTMHSDVSVYIAFSGEFFIRRLKRRRKATSTGDGGQGPNHHGEEHPHEDIEPTPSNDDPSTDPSHYELVIDNDSGTYRPKAALLPVLASFLAQSLPGLHIHTLDCQKDVDKMAHLKSQQRERKKSEGDHIVYAQGNDSDSLSSSDDERLDAVQDAWTAEQTADAQGAGSGKDEPPARTAARDWKRKQQAKAQKGKRFFANRDREGEGPQEALSSPTG